MTVIEHYVLSTRIVGKLENKVTYLEKKDVGRRKADIALDHFNLGKYSINVSPDGSKREHFKADHPEFVTYNDSEELMDFRKYPDCNFKPDKELSAVLQEIFESLKPEDKILYIYLHGFGNDADKELNKQVIPMTECFHPHSHNNYSNIGKMIFLTWPSQGFLQYKHGEKEDVSKMGTLAAVFFLKLRNFVKNKNNPLFSNWEPKIVFHAQSMGNKILLHAVNRINFLQGAGLIKNNILDGFFHRIVMTGADIDLDALDDEPDNNGEEIHQWTKRVILFYNKKDRALWISRFIFFSGKRLGRHIDEETIRELPDNIELVELHGNGKDAIGHNYFTEQVPVAQGICRALNDFHFDGTALENRTRKTEYHIKKNEFVSDYFG